MHSKSNGVGVGVGGGEKAIGAAQDFTLWLHSRWRDCLVLRSHLRHLSRCHNPDCLALGNDLSAHATIAPPPEYVHKVRDSGDANDAGRGDRVPGRGIDHAMLSAARHGRGRRRCIPSTLVHPWRASYANSCNFQGLRNSDWRGVRRVCRIWTVTGDVRGAKKAHDCSSDIFLLSLLGILSLALHQYHCLQNFLPPAETIPRPAASQGIETLARLQSASQGQLRSTGRVSQEVW